MKYRKMIKPDRLTNPQDVSVIEKMAKYYSLRPADEIARKMEMKWGIDRLPKLVGTAMAQKFGITAAKLDRAIDNDDEFAVEKHSASMVKAWAALDREAERQGHKPLDPNPLASWRTDGVAYCLFETWEDAYQFATSPEGEGIKTYCLDEAARCVEAFENQYRILAYCKEEIPGSKLAEVKGIVKDMEIPF